MQLPSHNKQTKVSSPDLHQTHLLLCCIEEVWGRVVQALLYLLHAGPIQVHWLTGVRVDKEAVDALSSWLVLQGADGRGGCGDKQNQ